MYLYCYARSKQGKLTGEKLLAGSEGEWIVNMEAFASGSMLYADRADAAVVLILHQETAVKLLMERLYPADIRCPVINIAPDGSYAGMLRSAGYNSYQMLSKITGILGCPSLSREDDVKDTAPDLLGAVDAYKMKADDEELLKRISDHIKSGGMADVYSDLPLELNEPVLDSLSFRTFLFQSNQKNELRQAYAAANAEDNDNYSVFITCSSLKDVPQNGRVLILVPKIIAVGIEISARSDPGYAAKVCLDTMINHGINPDAVATVAVSALAKESETVRAIADAFGCFVTFFDSRLLKVVKVPLNTGFGTEKAESDFCTAAACLAADNGRIVLRRAGSRNAVLLTAVMKRSPVVLT